MVPVGGPSCGSWRGGKIRWAWPPGRGAPTPRPQHDSRGAWPSRRPNPPGHNRTAGEYESIGGRAPRPQQRQPGSHGVQGGLWEAWAAALAAGSTSAAATAAPGTTGSLACEITQCLYTIYIFCTHKFINVLVIKLTFQAPPFDLKQCSIQHFSRRFRT